MGIPKQTHCKRGHERTAENVDSNYTCLLCKHLADAARRKPSVTKSCAWCNEDFTTTKSKQVYCGRQCKHSAHVKKHNAARGIRVAKTRWHYGLTHEERFLIDTLWSREQRKDYERKRTAHNKAKLHRRNARIRGNGGSWTGKQWVALKAAHEDKCLGCGRTETEVIAMGRKLVPDHIKPLSLGGANSIENLQPLCHGDGSSCNMLKSARWIDYRPGFPLEIS